VRKLGLTAGFFSSAVVLSQYLLPASFQFWTGAAFLTFFAALLFIRRCRALRYAALGLAVGLMWNYACAACGLFLSSARELDGGTRTVEAEVLAYPEDTDYGKSVLILVDTEGSAFGAKCRLYIYDEDYAPLEPGDKIRVCASFVLTGAKAGDDYYYSIGIPLFAYAESGPELLGKTPIDMLGSLRFIPVKAGRLLGESIDGVCGPAAPLVKAIITGDRNDLRADTYMYSLMNVTGVIHCVSISGMHVSFLAGLIYFLLGKRRFASLVCVFSVLFFMAMTGFSAPIVRAGVMQLAICGASLTRREYDPKTALFFIPCHSAAAQSLRRT
jgi:competence protein ComEC